MKSSPAVVFFGTPEFASHTLEHLIQHDVNIVAVVTTPDKPQGRGLGVRSSAVKETALRHGLPVLTPARLKDPGLVEELRRFSADIFCVVAYKILPREVFTLPRLGSFNVHASLLPKYRGAAPINWAIINGETQTGITTFLLEDKVDTGQMLLQESIAIGPDETAGELHDRLMDLGARLALRTVHGLGEGTLQPKPQVDQQATPAPKIFPQDCVIDFDRPAEQVHNFVRGLSPYPGATTTMVSGVRLKILRTRLSMDESVPLAPGHYQISNDGSHLYVGTTNAPVEILELQREGKRVMSAQEFLRGGRSLFLT